MKNFRKKFTALAAPVLLALTPVFATAAPQKFTPRSPTGEACPAPGALGAREFLTPAFDVPAKEQQRLLQSIGMNIGRKNPDGYFAERTLQSINEYRLIKGRPGWRDGLTPMEASEIRTLATGTKALQKKTGVSLETAVALKLAAERTSVAPEKILESIESGSAFPGGDAGFLYTLAKYSKKYGLQDYIDAIDITYEEGDALVRVRDPLMLEQLLALKDHPRLSVLLRAEHLEPLEDIPPTYFADTQTVFGDLATVQKNLATLGFDLGREKEKGAAGPLTQAAFEKFKALYAPAYGFFGNQMMGTGDAAETYLGLFAGQAKKDAARYSITSAPAAAIRLANIRTGADFGYMMELSSAESSFDPDAAAKTSSATGLYQFTEDTWLHVIRRYGEKYGLAGGAKDISAESDLYGITVARHENPFERYALLELRRDPHLAALFSAEFQMRNKWLVECGIGREINRTEQYLGHFLGPRGAAHFLNKLKTSPGASAAKIFPTAAAANKSIFYTRDRKGRLVPRSLKQVYQTLDKKFDNGKFEDHKEKVKTPVIPEV